MTLQPIFTAAAEPPGPGAAGDVPGITFIAGQGRRSGSGDHAKIADRLQPGRIGVELSEEFPLPSEQFTDAIAVHPAETERSTR